MQANNIICYLTEGLVAYLNARGKTDCKGLSKDTMDITLMNINMAKKFLQIPLPSRLSKATTNHFHIIIGEMDKIKYYIYFYKYHKVV